MDADAVTVRVVREHDAASFVDYGGDYGGGASGNPFLTPAPPRTPTPTRRDDYERRKPSATTTTLMDSVSSRADAAERAEHDRASMLGDGDLLSDGTRRDRRRRGGGGGKPPPPPPPTTTNLTKARRDDAWTRRADAARDGDGDGDGRAAASASASPRDVFTRRRLLLVVLGACVVFALGVGVGVGAERRLADSGDDENIDGGTGPGPWTTPNAYAAATRASDDRVSFLVVGDWGRRGGVEQRAVARAMGECAVVSRPDFVVSVGDNFYEGGLHSTDDVEFAESFANVYDAASLQVPWHAILGNHDYGDCGVNETTREELDCPKPEDASRSPTFQLDRALRDRDWRWHAERSFEMRPVGDVHLFFVDTSPLVRAYRNAKWASIPGGLADVSTPSAADVASNLARDLAASNARWKLVFGHHPMRSNGFWRDETADVRDALETTLVDGDVAAYFNGHDHDLQHTRAELVKSGGGGEVRALHHYTSGAGSKTGRGFGVNETLFERDDPGFVSVHVSSERIRVQFWGSAAGGGGAGGEGARAPLYEHVIARAPGGA